MTMVNSLATLVDLREREVDRLVGVMAEKEATRQRYRANLERMARLSAGESTRHALPMALALNQAGYKQALLDVAATHRQDLALHEADMAVTQQALTQASHKREALDQVLTLRQNELQQAAEKRAQKQQDEIAGLVWLRGRT